MWIVIVTVSYLLSQNCLGLNLIDLPTPRESNMSNVKESIQRRNFKPPETIRQKNTNRRFRKTAENEDKLEEEDAKEKDENLKAKITSLTDKTINDTDDKIKSIKHLKEPIVESPPYKVGFVLSLVKKAREVLNELFNAAVKHRDSWKALEQLKILELIVHTNVDTANLVRQLVEIHLVYLNSTDSNLKKIVVFK